MSPPDDPARDDTWQMLHEIARLDALEIRRPHGDVQIWPLEGTYLSLITIRRGDLTEEDADPVLRAATAAALTALKGLPK